MTKEDNNKVQFVDKKKMIIVCTECGGSGKMLDWGVAAYSMGTNLELKPCWICEGTGTLQLKKPINVVAE